MSRENIRVCHLSSVHYAQEARILYKECRSLAAYYDVFLIALHDKKEEIDGVQIIPLLPPKSRLKRFLFTDQILLAKAIRLNADIYHFHDPELIPAGFILKLLGKKVIYDIHELVDQDLTEKKWLPFKKLFRTAYRNMEQGARKAFAFVFANEATADHYAPLQPDETTVLNYVPFEMLKDFGKKVLSDSNKLLWVGSLGSKRGLLQLIEALYILQQRNILLTLDIAGRFTTTAAETIKSCAHYPAVAGQIRFLGFKPLPQAYQNASDYLAGLALLDYTENHALHAPTKQYEYMAVGLPFIISNFPKHRSFVEQYHCGVAVDVQSPSAIADALEYLCLHQEVAFKIGQNGREIIESGLFNWASEEKKLLELYRKLL